MDAFAECNVMVCGDLAVGVERVAVDGDCGEGDVAASEFGEEFFAGFWIFDEVIHVEVGVTGIGSGTKFDGLDAEVLDDIEDFGKGFVAKEGGEQSDFHVG